MFILSCGDDGKKKDKRTLEGVTVRDLSEEDIEKAVIFAQKLADDAGKGDATAVKNAFDTKALFLRALDGIEIPADDYPQFIKGMEDGANRRPGGVAWSLVGQDMKFLRISEFEGMPMPLFRLNTPDGTNYLHIMTLPSDSGKMKAVDMHILTSGEWTSQSTRRLILPYLQQMLGSRSRTAFQKEESEFVEQIEKIQAVSAAHQSGNITALHQAYQSLPPSLQKLRFLRVIYLNSLLGDKEAHLEEARRFEQDYPNDPATAFMLVDADFVREDWEGALAKIDIVRKTIGGDVYLDFLSANIVMSQGNHAKAAEMIRDSLQKEPEIEDAWWTLFSCLVELKKHEDLANEIKNYNQQFKIELTADDFEPEFIGDFLNSAPGKALFATE